MPRSHVKTHTPYDGAPQCWRRSQKPGVSDQTFPPTERLAHETTLVWFKKLSYVWSKIERLCSKLPMQQRMIELYVDDLEHIARKEHQTPNSSHTTSISDKHLKKFIVLL